MAQVHVMVSQGKTWGGRPWTQKPAKLPPAVTWAFWFLVSLPLLVTLGVFLFFLFFLTHCKACRILVP